MRELPKKSLPIINEIIEALASIRLTCYEFNVIMAILRKTYGWAKKDDWIALSQLEKLTGIASRHCSRTLRKLFAKNIIVRNGRNIGINKKTKTWIVPNEGVPNQGANTPQLGPEVLPNQGDTKNNLTKDTNNNEEEEKIKKILTKWLKNFDQIENPESYARSLLQKYPVKILRRALDSSTCTSPSNLSSLIEFYLKK